MKIQNVQNNNTNFQGLYGSKRALMSLKHSPLKTEVEKLAKNCDVLVKKETTPFQVLSGLGIGGLSGISVALLGSPTVFLPIFALSVFAAISVVFIISLGKTNNTIQIGEKIKKDGESDEFKFNGIKSTEIELNDKADLKDLEKDYISQIMLYGSDESKKKCANRYAKIQLIKDENGNLPIHNIKQTSDIERLNANLRDNMEDLAEIYLTKNNKGELPIHNPLIMTDTLVLENILKIFKNYPRLLVTIFEAKNKQGESVIDILQKKYSRRYPGTVERFMESIDEAKEFCIKNKGSFVPMRAKSEVKTQNKLNHMIHLEANYQNIVNMLKDKDCQDSKGYLLNNSDYITKIIDFTINNASKDEANSIIQELQNLPNIDYNQVDENNISVAEKIMNAEDFELLKLLDSKKLNYYPELDYAFARIENGDFKELVQKFNFEFKDLEQAVRIKSMRSLEILEKQFSSPLFKKEYNGEILLNEVGTESSSFAKQFFGKYGQYLSDYII